MRAIIENHMSLWLFAGCMAGLLFPYWDWAPDLLVTLILMTATFIACFKLKLSELKALPLGLLAGFCVLRYGVIAWVVYTVLGLIFPPDIALAGMLIAAVPAAVSSPALTHMLGGQVTLAVTITLAASFLVPFSMPLLFSFSHGANISPDPLELLYSLVLILMVPGIVFALAHRWQGLRAQVDHYGKTITVLLVALMLAVVVGKQREFVLDEIPLLVHMVVLTLALQSLLLWCGWAAGMRRSREEQLALAITSGLNNAALGVALAALHFSPVVVVVMVAAEISWAMVPLVLRWLRSPL